MFFRHLAVVLHGLFSIESVSHQPAMSALLYLRLIGFAAGTLVHLFLVVLVAGYRRPRAFERVLFFLALTLFLFYSGALLGLNAEIYYASPPPANTRSCRRAGGCRAGVPSAASGASPRGLRRHSWRSSFAGLDEGAGVRGLSPAGLFRPFRFPQAAGYSSACVPVARQPDRRQLRTLAGRRDVDGGLLQPPVCSPGVRTERAAFAPGPDLFLCRWGRDGFLYLRSGRPARPVVVGSAGHSGDAFVAFPQLAARLLHPALQLPADRRATQSGLRCLGGISGAALSCRGAAR